MWKGFGVTGGQIKKAGLADRLVSAELCGETTTVGLRRIDWILRQPGDVIGGGWKDTV